ncbi:helix-turn-helix domain-containing protein [Kiloniella sp. EL199]|uniref:helix-turn-helix domain-containing protein n=1 Tax=Kiloniella sp. EL199 TaxID=2107581 RepID=UPI000EA272C4|nr:XRE family transcriptional regulator [Kiloniella sp. EL199]
MTPVSLIAQAIQRERTRAKMSLSALAAQAGVAKSTLSQLEGGQGNPSLETLWAIASALNIPLSFLFETPKADFRIIRADEEDQLSSDLSELSSTLLADCPTSCRRDIYRVYLKSGSVREAEAHTQNTIEHAFVCRGQVRLGPVDNLQELTEGDYFRYPADVKHSYEALSDKAMLILIMENPG